MQQRKVARVPVGNTFETVEESLDVQRLSAFPIREQDRGEAELLDELDLGEQRLRLEEARETVLHNDDDACALRLGYANQPWGRLCLDPQRPHPAKKV